MYKEGREVEINEAEAFIGGDDMQKIEAFVQELYNDWIERVDVEEDKKEGTEDEGETLEEVRSEDDQKMQEARNKARATMIKKIIKKHLVASFLDRTGGDSFEQWKEKGDYAVGGLRVPDEHDGEVPIFYKRPLHEDPSEQRKRRIEEGNSRRCGLDYYDNRRDMGEVVRKTDGKRSHPDQYSGRYGRTNRDD